MTSGSTGSPSFPSWKLALLIGTPVAIGIGYYIYRKQSKALSEDTTDSTTKDKTIKSLKDKSISIDGDSTPSTSDKDLSQKEKQELEKAKLTPLALAQQYKNDGNVCFRKGKYDEAIKLYDKAISGCPPENKMDLAVFYQNRAAAYEMLKKWAQVKADCTKSLEYNPRYAKAYFRRAKAHEQTKDWLDCLDDVTATCILEVFQNNNTILYADRVLKQTGNDDAAKAMKTRVPVLPSRYFIKTYFRSFVCDPLINMKPEPRDGELRGFARAKLAWDNEDYDAVIPACTEEIESSESESEYKMEALLLRGTFHLLSGCFTGAQQDFDVIIDNEEADVELRVNALIKRASLWIQLIEKEKGLADFEEAEELSPDNADIYHQRAQIYTLLDQLDVAMQEYEKAVKLAPHHAMAFIQKCYAEYRLAFVVQDQMRLSAVMNEFKNAIEKYPDCVECYSLMAQVLSDQSQYDQADSFFEKATKMAPDNASLYVHRGIMELQWSGDIAKALRYMHKSIEIDEKCELAYETLGTIEVQRAYLDKAVELFDKAIIYAKSLPEMGHLYALRNAAIAQINVTKKLGIDMASISAAANAGIPEVNGH
ncbi:unnamed protein product [Hermetia illucens]|uniref:Mitochondrial import receptor subunit TOM70 n=1 Tax=Hermetia illucens TaxID=343691 RepID=A0A7R8UGT4_HERIL|nr:mitochondrial import receptor subunit TOM70 isoform X1 [Hermetia illucens]XP_037915054.1 mitochondrial import receptor subunit TOM70 isoform X1 [Hermetia illucens]CAD7079747.1 unnamed protein product [Hermetia illucens]